MKKTFGVMASLAALAIWVSSAQAAITVAVAEARDGWAYVAGTSTEPNKTHVIWEGRAISNVNKFGQFSFYGTLAPDCKGDLIIGSDNELGIMLDNCTPIQAGPPAPVAKTGQTATIPIDPAPAGSDGALNKGVAWPNPRFTVANGTVTDNLTGLIWLQNANCPGGTRTWQGALDFVAGINSGSNDCGDTSNTGGTYQTDWRLPNIRELQSLVDLGFYNPPRSNVSGTGKAVPGSDDPFINFQGFDYWSSTTSAYRTDNAWYVNFLLGAGTWSFKVEQIGFVIAVRGGS